MKKKEEGKIYQRNNNEIKIKKIKIRKKQINKKKEKT